MKSAPYLIAFVFCGSLGFAADVPEFNTLRKNYRDELVQVEAPVRLKYRNALLQLKDRLMKSGKLQDATVVETELKVIEEITRQSAGDASVIERLLGTKWQWWEGQSIEFRPLGQGVYHGLGGKETTFRWTVAADGRINYRNEELGDPPFTLELENDHLKITNEKGQSWNGRYLGKAK